MQRVATLILAFVGLKSLSVFGEFCDKRVRLKLHGKLDGRVENNTSDGSISHLGTVYPNGTFWKDGDDLYGCPCTFNTCIRICQREHAERLAKQKVSLPLEDRKIVVLMFINGSKEVNLSDHFFVLEEAVCSPVFMLSPEKEPLDKHYILENGSLIFTENGVILGPESYCIAALTDAVAPIKAVYCPSDEDYEDYRKKFKWNELTSKIFTFFMATSIICLFFVLIAYCISPEMQNLHGKSVACQSGTLMLGFIGYTLTFFNRSASENVCKVIVYATYTFMMSSFFWLNTMCLDIFWTFSDLGKMTSSLDDSSHEKKFTLYAIYSTTLPLILSLSLIILDNTFFSSYRPGIGEGICWFKDSSAERLYYQGPVIILLIVNFAFFAVTLVRILKMKKASNILNSGDCVTHRAGKRVKDEKNRFVVYVKLFLLMGGTSTMQIPSWTLAKPGNWFWLMFDVINFSRGVLILTFCVLLNEKVRTPLFSRISQKFKDVTKKPSPQTEMCLR